MSKGQQIPEDNRISTRQLSELSVYFFKNSIQFERHLKNSNNGSVTSLSSSASRSIEFALAGAEDLLGSSWQMKVIVNEVHNQPNTLLTLLMTVRKTALEIITCR